MDLYADNILDHYRHPRGKQVLSHPSASHQEENISCGDELTVQLTIENERVIEIGWQGTGCAISQAAMSMLSEELAGMSIEDIEQLSPQHVYDLLGVPVGPRRHKCALLCLHTLKNALRKQKGEEAQGWNMTVAVDN